MKLLVIVPCYNEAETVAAVVAEVRAALPGADLLVVDDGSTDGSGEAAAAAGAAVASLPSNMGIGTAVQTGYRYAREEGYDAAAQVDGDGQHDPAELPKLLKAIEEGEADLVVGSRFLGAAGFSSTPARRVGIRIFSRVLSLLIGEPLTDPTSGFRAVNRKGIDLFARTYPDDYPEVESLYFAHLAGLGTREAPVSMRARAGGKSSITPLRAVYYMLKVMMVILIWTVRGSPAGKGKTWKRD